MERATRLLRFARNDKSEHVLARSASDEAISILVIVHLSSAPSQNVQFVHFEKSVV